MPSTPFAAALVLSYTRFGQTTQPCLESLLAQTVPLGIPVVVLDNHSADTAAHELAQYAAGLPEPPHVLLHHTNLGYGGGMNFGVAHLRNTLAIEPRWLLLINSDTRFPPDTVAVWLQALRCVPSNVGIVAPVTNSAGNAQRIATLAANDYAGAQTIARQLLLQQPVGYTLCYRADFFCVAIRTQLWQLLGGFDPAYGMGYYEDVDFCLRAATLGYKSAFTENVFVFHSGSAAFAHEATQGKLMRKNKRIFLAKFPHAELRHAREENWRLIKTYVHTLCSAHDTQIQYRLDLRLRTAWMSLPKSPLKKLRWLLCLGVVHLKLWYCKKHSPAI